LFLIWF